MVSLTIGITQFVLEFFGLVFFLILVKSYISFKSKALIAWVKEISWLGLKLSVNGEKNKSLSFKFEKL